MGRGSVHEGGGRGRVTVHGVKGGQCPEGEGGGGGSVTSPQLHIAWLVSKQELCLANIYQLFPHCGDGNK